MELANAPVRSINKKDLRVLFLWAKEKEQESKSGVEVPQLCTSTEQTQVKQRVTISLVGTPDGLHSFSRIQKYSQKYFFSYIDYSILALTNQTKDDKRKRQIQRRVHYDNETFSIRRAS
jgi:hypothetical protein